ncbi:MAG: RNA 2'-phosphotransferase [Euryarchaeota archaeon]|nr:RNA 2'-phosphotransferase [Euryarchaeota archaeon]
MLAECKRHGYFRAELCPACEEKGRFMMNDEELERIGRIMAGVLRHFPDRFGVTMDGHGWVDLNQFVGAVRQAKPHYHWLRPYHIQAIVETDPKGRYQMDGGMVRATYAHSVEVNLDDLPDANTDELYFPCSEEELDILLEKGLNPTDRKKIHLSGTLEKAVQAGRVKIESPIILAIDAGTATKDGLKIKRAAKTVYIADAVPSKYLKKLDVDMTQFATPGPGEGED